MSLTWSQLVVDSADPAAQARWWQQALGWQHLHSDDEEGWIELGPAPSAAPTLLFIQVPEGKTVKNRLHLDFVPDDQAAEVARLLRLGAVRADVGQGDDVSWVVLADPEGNEFCILRATPDA